MVKEEEIENVKRMKVMLVKGDVLENRGKDKVIKKIEDLKEGKMKVKECLRKVRSYLESIKRKEKIIKEMNREFRKMKEKED